MKENDFEALLQKCKEYATKRRLEHNKPSNRNEDDMDCDNVGAKSAK